MATRKQQLDALREAFEVWSSEHGLVWFNNDVELAEAIAGVLGIDLVWGEGVARVGVVPPSAPKEEA